MSWWSWISGGAASLGSDIYGGFDTVYTATIGAGTTGITDAEKLGGQIASDASGFTTSIFLNWFFQLIIYPVVHVVSWIMGEVVGALMKGVAVIVGLIFALPDGIVIWLEDHIISMGIASPIALSIAIGIILVVSIGIGLILIKGIQLIVQEA